MEGGQWRWAPRAWRWAWAWEQVVVVVVGGGVGGLAVAVWLMSMRKDWKERESGVVDRACPPVSASLWSRDGRCRRLGKYLLGLPYSRVLRTCDQPGALMEMEKEQVNRNRNEVLGPGSNNDRRRRRRRWRQQQRVGPASTVHSATRDYERPGACEEGPRE